MTVGFEVSGKLVTRHEAQFDDWVDSFIAHAIAGAGLHTGGGGDGNGWSFVVYRPSGDVSADDRDGVVAWLAADPRIESWQAGELTDLDQEDS